MENVLEKIEFDDDDFVWVVDLDFRLENDADIEVEENINFRDTQHDLS